MIRHRPIGIVQLRIREVMHGAPVWHLSAIADVVDRAESQARTALASLVERGMVTDLGGRYFTETCRIAGRPGLRGRCLWPLRSSAWVDPQLWDNADARCAAKYQDDDKHRLDRCWP